MSEFIEDIQERHGLFRNVPRTIRRAVERRLGSLEADAEAFDREALVNHARLKRLYALLHVPPGERGRTLFGKPPAESARAALRQLATVKNPRAAAVLVRTHRLPYLLVESVLGTIPEPVAVALVETLEGEELLARLPLMARHGLIQGETRTALLGRLALWARGGARGLSYQAVESIVRKAELDRQVAQALFALVGGPRSSPEELDGPTALMADVSSSMAREGGCLELAASVAWRIDQALAADARLEVYQFASDARPVAVRRRSGLDQWRALFTVPAPSVPGTSVGAAIDGLAADALAVSRLIIVSDGYENRAPRLVPALERYRAAIGARPQVHLVQPSGSARQLATDLRTAQVPFTVFTVDQHLLGLDAMIASFVAGASADRVAEILAYE